MKLTPEEINKYATSYPITSSNVIRMANHLPSIPVLELCLELTTYGYHADDCIAMLEAAYKRGQKTGLTNMLLQEIVDGWTIE